MEFSGRLASFPIAELLTWAANDRRTGSLVLRRTSREKTIYFDDGKVVSCQTDSATEYYGQHLLLEGYLDPQTLLRCLVLCKEEGKRLGFILVELGILELPVVQRTLKEQIEDLVCDIFLWDRGIFYFQNDQPPEEEILAQPINSLALILEGTRWVDEMGRIREVFKHDNLYLSRSTAKRPENLNPRAAMILRKLEGSKKTIAQLYRVTGGSYFRFLTDACDLKERGLLRALDQGEDSPKTTHELPLSNLLLEQAAEEAHESLMVPLAVLEGFVPVWMNKPDAATLRKLPEADRAFLAQFDGKRRLRDLMSRDRDARSRETELLILQMQRAALALVPAPLEELELDGEK